jgi:two-component system, LytTR family, response regulator
MDTLRVVLADDEPPARRRLRALLAEIGGVEVVAECADGVEAVRAIEAASPDIAFLDVQMPGLDGFEVVEALGARAMPAVVFVTAHGHYALQAFEVHAVDYLLKPFDAERLRTTIGRVRDRITRGAMAAPTDLLARIERGPLQRIAARTGDTIQIIDVGQVEWIEAERNYVRIHVRDRSYLVRSTLNALEQRLDRADFVRVHRGAILRIAAVRELEPLFQGEYAIRLASGATVRSSRRFRESVHRALGVG